MGQEYSAHDITSVSYPEAVGYIRKTRGKKSKYPLSKAEIASFSKIPYAKYVPLDDRNTASYKRSLQSHSPTRSLKTNENRAVGNKAKTSNQGRYTPASSAPSRGRTPVSHYAGKSAGKSNSSHNTSVGSSSAAGNSSMNTSLSSSKKSVQSPNTSLVSVKEGKKKGKSGSKEQKSKFVPRNDKEIQLSKIYIKPQDLVIEKTKKKKKGKKSGDKKETKSNKQKALFRIRKKTRVEPTPVYLESPFKRHKTIRIKKSQIAPYVINSKPRSVQTQNTVSQDSFDDSHFERQQVPHRSRSPIKERGSRVPRNSRSPVKSPAMDLDVVGTKAQLFKREIDSKPGTPEPEALFTKRSRSQSLSKPILDRPRTVSEIRQTTPTNRTKPIERPQTSPYKVSVFAAAGGTIYPAYRGKNSKATSQISDKKTQGANSNTANKKTKRSSVAPMGSKVGNKGQIKIVRGKKADPKGADEAKVRLKWFNVLHRSHYQNHINSLYDADQVNNGYITEDELPQKLVNEENHSSVNGSEWRTECRSFNTYSDSMLTNTTVSTANATVVGELDRNLTEVDYEPSILSEITVVNSDTSTLVNDYEGDGETDLDKPLRFKHKKSPELLRKDLLKMREIYFKNHPGVEQETDTDTDTSTITENFPSLGHVEKMRQLFGVITNNQQTTQSRQTPLRPGNSNNISRTPVVVREQPYQPSFINNNNPAHLFQAKAQDNKENGVCIVDKVKNGSMKNAKSSNIKSVPIIKEKPKVSKTLQTKPTVKAPVISAKTPVIVQRKGKSPTFLTEPSTPKKNVTKNTSLRGRSTFYGAEPDSMAKKKQKDLPSFLKPTNDSMANQKSEVPPVKMETKKSIIDVIAQEETKELLEQVDVDSSDTDSLQDLDDAAAMADKQQQNVRRVLVQEVNYNGDINASLSALWDKQHSVDAQKSNPVTPKSPKSLRNSVNINGMGGFGEESKSPRRIDTRKSSDQAIFVRPLNPVHTYRRERGPVMHSNDIENNSPETELRRNPDFASKRDFFENKDTKPPLTNNVAATPNGNSHLEQQVTNNTEMTQSQSSEQNVTIEGNYDSFARQAKYPTKTFESQKSEVLDKEGLRLPKIVDKTGFGLYSRHGPVPSPGLPTQGKQQRQTSKMGLYSGPSPAASATTKASRYSSYTWKNWS